MRPRNKQFQTFFQFCSFYFTDSITRKIKRNKFLRRRVKRKWKHCISPYYKPKR